MIQVTRIRHPDEGPFDPAKNETKVTAHNLRQLRRTIDGSQPIDLPGAIMAINHLIAVADAAEAMERMMAEVNKP